MKRIIYAIHFGFSIYWSIFMSALMLKTMMPDGPVNLFFFLFIGCSLVLFKISFLDFLKFYKDESR